MAKRKVPLSLKEPDAILLVYGDTTFKVSMGRFEDYIVAVDEDKVKNMLPYLAMPTKK